MLLDATLVNNLSYSKHTITYTPTPETWRGEKTPPVK